MVIFKTVFVDVSIGRHDHVISLISKDRSLNEDSAVTQTAKDTFDIFVPTQNSVELL